MALLTGTRFGSYEILSLLGVGGMGEVYRARDLQLNRDVAVKVLLNLSTDTQRLHRFEQEARAAAALNHPNILAVYFMGRYEGAPYLVSELLEGETLRGLIKRGALPPRKAIDCGVQIAHGLQAAHERGIVHRDLKPENLFVTRDGRVKILDFGLAKLTQPLQTSEFGPGTVISGTEPGVVMGTVGYMSPEQVRGDSSDHRTDIFAFGVVLYEMLTGKRAFQKPTATETMTAILNEDPINVIDLVPNLPPGLQRIVHRCLEKGLEQRFQSAADLAFALESVAEDSLSGQRPIIVPQPRNRTARLAILGALLVVATTTIFWQWPHLHSKPQLPPQPASTPATDPRGAILSPATNPKPDAAQSDATHSATPPVATPAPKSNDSSSSPAPKQTAPPSTDSATDRLQQDAQLEAMAQEAQSSLNAADYRSALDICGKVLALSPASQPCSAIRQHASIKLAEQLVSEGNAYWEKGEFDHALHNAEKAIDLDPANQNAVKLKQLAMHMKTQSPK